MEMTQFIGSQTIQWFDLENDMSGYYKYDSDEIASQRLAFFASQGVKTDASRLHQSTTGVDGQPGLFVQNTEWISQ